MQFKDCLFNWLQIQIVQDARPSDRSARETVQFFEEMLREDHGVEQLEKQKEGDQYVVRYQQSGEEKEEKFPKVFAEKLLRDILAEPKYNQTSED
ncbi:hypothetical protein [Thermoactinomyces mirandus]|uniref:Uncharacterized protein n=1 Tax=Thermoactinomyces mirandus TaxID=2756294 RepID=A0A7W1XQH9_9BACL|nr:hypothetical protein [Thermoactinomyces mirandus]MBA4601195.1 hypothetical protein [Thermoactinomyces mirandus]